MKITTSALQSCLCVLQIYDWLYSLWSFNLFYKTDEFLKNLNLYNSCFFVYKFSYLFAERNFHCLTSFVEMSDTTSCQIILISLLSSKWFISYLLRFCSATVLSITQSVVKHFQPNENPHTLPGNLYLLFQINLRSSFLIFIFFNFLFCISPSYGLDLRCTFFYSSLHPHPYTSLFSFFVYFKDSLFSFHL